MILPRVVTEIELTKQNKTDESLTTTNKTITGAINELKSDSNNVVADINDLKNKIAVTNNGKAMNIAPDAIEQTIGYFSVYIGISEERRNSTGDNNVSIGYNTLRKITTGKDNTCTGTGVARSLTTGSGNTLSGKAAGYAITTGSNSTCIGFNAGYSLTNNNNVICIGANSGPSSNSNISNAIYLGDNNIRQAYCAVEFSTASDERIKTDIEVANTKLCLENVLNLAVKRYKYKDGVFVNKTDKHVLGWLAQDVEQIFPHSVTTSPKDITSLDENGKPITIKVTNENGEEEQTVKTTLEDCKHINKDQLLPTLWGAVQELTQIVYKLENEIKKLKEN